VTETGAARITAEELRELYRSGAEVVVLDVRTTDARVVHPERIPEARWIPLADITRSAPALPRGAVIAAYCT
jgi:rhodanese-related sulfurtransferase